MNKRRYDLEIVNFFASIIMAAVGIAAFFALFIIFN